MTPSDAESFSHYRPLISLAGTWRAVLDPDNRGIEERWFAEFPEEGIERVELPGTTDANEIGEVVRDSTTMHLNRRRRFVGPAWYERQVDVPDDWSIRSIHLFLERTKATQLWVDGREVGRCESLSTPHVYDLTEILTPGRRRLTIRVDNTPLPFIGQPHGISEHTQTNWNGIIGRMELRAAPLAWIDDVQIHGRPPQEPDAAPQAIRLAVTLRNVTGGELSGGLRVRAAAADDASSATHRGEPAQAPVQLPSGREARTIVLVDYDLGVKALAWDEFSPVVYNLEMALGLRSDSGLEVLDHITASFGLRDFETCEGQFSINGRHTFLRGKHDACVFPRTGHPPMDVDAWLEVFRTARSWGINHYRFHTWCPPEAAFRAADLLGIYLQPELPNWAPFGDPEHDAWMRREGQRIFQAFGNHPSFVMFSLGNEFPRNDATAETVEAFRRTDRRRLYTQSTNGDFADPAPLPADDYWATMLTRREDSERGLAVRGSFATVDFRAGHIENQPPSTLHDYSEAIRDVPMPVIGHEVGQYQVYPDFGEIAKYTGVLAPGNLEIFRDRAARAGIIGRTFAAGNHGGDYHRASGALALLCYREEIETALRTPGFGGFRLLDLQDYPGQGTALVGMLDAFMDSKGIATPEEWRRFCSSTVLLARFSSYVWRTGDVFEADVEVAHYGAHDLPARALRWILEDASGREAASGALPPMQLRAGCVNALGHIAAPLVRAEAPARLRLRLWLEGSDIENSWALYVYPEHLDLEAPEGVTVCRQLDRETQAFLVAGGRVVLFPRTEDLKNTVPPGFQPDFWCFPMFDRIARDRNAPPSHGTLGVFCEPAHPALARFPTESHSDWHWWHIVKHAPPLIFDEAPRDLEPIVQTIDNIERSHRLGILFEARVGEGRLLVCSANLPELADHPAAAQLLHSLLRYAAEEDFRPEATLNLDEIGALLQ